MDWSAFIGPTVAAAVISALMAWLVASLNNRANRAALERRIDADLEMTVAKFQADREKAMSDKAWADYELRRDTYFCLIGVIDSLFEHGDRSEKPEYLRLARRVRLVGSDQVIRALNAFNDSIKLGEAAEVRERRYRELFIALRLDIRELHAIPPTGTDLKEEAFPIEA